LKKLLASLALVGMAVVEYDDADLDCAHAIPGTAETHEAVAYSDRWDAD